MVGYDRPMGGYKLSSSNSMAPFYSEVEKRKKAIKAQVKRELEDKPTQTTPQSYDNIKLFGLNYKFRI